MDDAALVGVLQGLADFGDKPHGFVERQRPFALQPVLERFPPTYPIA
jgi:hypothetical protein